MKKAVRRKKLAFDFSLHHILLPLGLVPPFLFAFMIENCTDQKYYLTWAIGVIFVIACIGTIINSFYTKYVWEDVHDDI
tara:strand:- start:195287 stop:195523 length:237 start_codon:yes stop_codon:yes gene_type:complete